MSTKLETYLKEVSDRAEAATPGPWTAHDDHGTKYVSNGNDGPFAKFDNRICEASFNLHHPPINKNMQLIAHARTDIPTLIKVVEKYREIANNYALHDYNCLIYEAEKCDCGLDKDFAELEATIEGGKT